MHEPLRIQGIVVTGKGEARTLGYPTANIEYTADTGIESGVWVCACLVEGQMMDGVGVVGMWKTVQDLPSVEVHILDVEQDLYGRTLDVLFLHRLRPLVAVKSVEELKELIQEDIEKTRSYLALHR